MNPLFSTTSVHRLAWKRVSSCSGIPPLLPAQFMHSSSCALFLTKWYGQYPLCFPSSVTSTLPVGSFLFCHTEPLSLLPTPKTRDIPRWGILPKFWIQKLKHSLFHHTDDGTPQGRDWSLTACTVGWKSWGERILSFPTWWQEKNCILCIYSQWDGFIYASKWTGPNTPCDSLFSAYRLRFLPISYFFLSHKGERGSFWISGKFW